MRFETALLIVIAALFLLELPRRFVSMALYPLYSPLIQLETFVRDVQKSREELDFILQMAPFERRVFVNKPVYDRPTNPTSIIVPFGSRDGISYGDPLVVYGCLVGKVVEVGPDRSRAITILNSQMVVPVYDKRSKLLSMVSGGNPPLMEYLQGQDVAAGDTLLTSGVEGIFPEGLVVGIVGEVVEEEKGVVIREVHLMCPLDRLNRFHIIRRGGD